MSRRWLGVKTWQLQRVQVIVLACLLASALTPGRANAQQSPSVGGRWSSLFKVAPGWTGVHSALLRGNGDTTLIIHMLSDTAARALLIPPDSSLIDPASPEPSWTATHLQVSVKSPSIGVDMFCGGHATLADGRLLFAGGTDIGVNGHRHARIFDPRSYFNPTNRGWLDTDSLNFARWYATLTTLGDGRVMAFSGLQYYEMLTLGGVTSAGSVVDSLHPMVLERSPYWNAGATPIPDVALGSHPPARTDAAMTPTTSLATNGPDNDVRGVLALFGGKDSLGQRLGDLWIGWRVGFNTREAWKWAQPGPDTVVAHNIPGSARVLPQPRSEHALVMTIRPGADTLFAYVFGGLKSGGVTDDSLWLIRYYRAVDVPNLPYYYTCVSIPTTGTKPGARYGQVAVFDPGPQSPSTGGNVRPKILVFGGKTAGGGLADNKVYSLDLDTKVWSVVHSGVNGPAARYQARGQFLPVGTDEYQPLNQIGRLFVFGGEDGSGARYQDLWRLSRCNNASGNCDTPYVWTRWDPVAGALPSARSRHVLIWDYQWKRLILTGGSLVGGVAAQDTTWYLPVNHQDTCSTGGASCLYWRAVGLAGNAPTAKSGQVAAYYSLPINTRRPEAFDPNAPGSKWSLLDAPRYTKDTYPFMFLLPSGNVFLAGRELRTVTSESTAVNTYGTSVMQRTPVAWQSPIASQFPGSSAVMYAPGKVLKVDNDSLKSSATIQLAGTPETGTWNLVTVDLMKSREEPNLVLLPTGDVLAMGGRYQHEDGSTARPRPQQFNAAAPGWSDEMNPDPSTRGYHSTAVLLPDARVLSLGGNIGSSDRLDSAAVFEPPYLFDGSNYAPRPLITGYDDSVGWGQHRWLGTNRLNSIRGVALMRPAATTHAFDQNQRIVLLSFSIDTTVGRLVVDVPADSNLAPPGDYMLFLVDSVSSSAKRVPSISRWVRVRHDSIAPDSLPKLADQEVMCSEAWFAFTATADDGSLASSGKVAGYDFRYVASNASSPPADRESWFATMNAVSDEPAPMVCDSTQSYLFTGLQPNTHYWFALRAVDGRGNKSPITAFKARTYSATVCSDESFVCVHCNSGGGGNRAQRATVLRDAGASPLTESPSLMDGAVPEQDATDLLPYAGGVGAEGTVRFTLQSAGRRSISIDRAGLMQVFHAPDDEVFWCSAGPVAGQRVPVSAVWLDDTVSTPGLAEGALTRPVALTDQQQVRLNLSQGGDDRTILIDCARPGSGISSPEEGIDVLRLDPDGAWATVAKAFPRTVRSRLAIAGLPAGDLKLLVKGDVELWGISELAPSSHPALPLEVRPSSATAARSGDVRSLLLSDDELRLDFSGPDTLSLEFTLSPPPEGVARSLFVSVRARLGAANAGAGNATQSRSTERPLSFALYQSRPNPSRGGALVPFDLPRAMAVRLEVFDPQGRRVYRRQQELLPGHHEWSVAGSGSTALAPGIYSYRLRAGSYQAHRKMVVLP